MKKGIAIIGTATLALAVYFLFFNSDKTKDDTPAAEPHVSTAASKNSDVFNTSFDSVLNNYYAIKEALVNWDTAAAIKANNDLQKSLSAVPFEELNNDSVITRAKNLSGQIAGEAEGFLAEKNIDGERHSFYALSEKLYSLIKAVHYDRQVIYHAKCPMAFNNEQDEGWWISNKNEVINPYFGTKHPRYKNAMINCGNIEDSVAN